MRVSVIVPVHNEEQALEDCIGSLLALQYPAEQFELIVVDNASTDGTPAILNRYRDRLRVGHEPRPGAAAARNQGMRMAQGEVMAFTDADCTVAPDWLTHLMQPLQDDSVSVVGGCILARRPCTPIEAFGETVHDNKSALLVYRLPYIDTANAAVRRSALQASGPFDERFLRGQDTELSCRLYRGGCRFEYAPAAVVYHRNSGTLWALLVEGWKHGLWAVLVRKVHVDLMRTIGYRRNGLGPYRAWFRQVWKWLRGTGPVYPVVFNLGKRVGQVCGSIRFRFLDL